MRYAQATHGFTVFMQTLNDAELEDRQNLAKVRNELAIARAEIATKDVRIEELEKWFENIPSLPTKK